MQAVAMRNENVAINRIDNNAIKEANVRSGAALTVINEFSAESGYYASEFGRPATGGLGLSGPAKLDGWHAELFESHQNSVFNARTFFQVGPVRPAHRNHYGGRAAGNLAKSTALTVTAAQRNVQGMVNGNVLVPLASERTPLSPDPALRALVGRWLEAYPNELPNRPDFDPRALNRNAPQRINEVDGTARLDQDLGRWGKLSAFHLINRTHINAFQLVAGQNPINDLRSHRSQLTWRWSASAATDAAAWGAFQRARTALTPEPNAVGPQVRMGYQIEELGPDAEYPVNRTANTFRYGGSVAHRRGNHALSFGGDIGRSQLNGIETSYSRGQFNFTNNFGRPALINFLLGTPSAYYVTIGEMARGYRTWNFNGFAADRWKLTPRLQLYLGLRFNLVTAPTEVNRLDIAPYSCDCNNVAPRFGFAWQPRGSWVVRGAYGVSFAEIQPVTFGQLRYNPPRTRTLQIQNPAALNPLAGVDLQAGRSSPNLLNADLVSPYTHQYNFSIEKKLAGAMARMSYLGSRSYKLLNGYTMNRAMPVPGIPLTLDTVDQRRADPRFYDVRNILNAGIGYLDAAIASFDLPAWRGIQVSASYTFSKAIDEGADFTSTAANRDVNRGRAQSQVNQLQDKKGLSNFDSPHAFLLSYTWDLPKVRGNALSRFLLNDWQFAGVTLRKTGTPMTLFVGSDAPGFGNVDGGPSDRPNIVDPSILGRAVTHPDLAPSIMQRDRFAYIRPGDLRGSIARNAMRKAPIANWNASLTKQWVHGGVREWRFQLRGEAFNLTNTPQFDEPQRNLTSPSFGRITNTLNDGRVFQFGLRLIL